MRSAEDVAQEIENDRFVRENELSLIKRYLSNAELEDDQKALRRSLIVLAYAHFEGFCRFALTAYLGAINSFELKHSQASVALVAASLDEVFDALRNEAKKHDLFRKLLKNDADVHRIARQQQFVNSYETGISSDTVVLSERIVDAKSNLNTIVLKRNLFVLGLPYPFLDEHRSSIDKLLHVRNSIAHGDTLMDPKPTAISEYLESMASIMSLVQTHIVTALVDKTYLRAA
jgi:hypothetical protein